MMKNTIWLTARQRPPLTLKDETAEGVRKTFLPYCADKRMQYILN